MALTVTLDKSVYTPGEAMVLTVATAPGERDRFTETPFTVDVNVAGVGAGQATALLKEPTSDAPVSISDPARTWVVRSDDGDTLIADATA